MKIERNGLHVLIYEIIAFKLRFYYFTRFFSLNVQDEFQKAIGFVIAAIFRTIF